MTEPTFPPLFQGQAVRVDPFDKAIAAAIAGVEAGRITHNLSASTLQAAVVLAPEVPLQQAMTMLPVAGVGFQNALGALAPPEVAVHLEWDGTVRVNGAVCGKLKVAASPHPPEEIPDWIVVGLTIQLWPEDEETGRNPDATALYAEGCADVDAVTLLESWARHFLVWINRWDQEGAEPVHREWRGLSHGMGEDASWKDHTGTFLGVDENFGMLLRTPDTTHLIPMTELLEKTV